MKMFSKRAVFLLVTGCWMLVTFLGCAGLSEGLKGFLGISTRELDGLRKEAITKTVNYDYLTSYKMTLNALKELGSYVYAKDPARRMIAAYRSETETTPVGIFLTAVEDQKTKIEVTSPSTLIKQDVAQKIFAAFEEK